MNTLVIEDDVQLNTTITNFLEFKKYQVSSCEDGQIAIDLIDKNEYDFYIIDVNLPTINGLDLVKYIRKKDINSPILMITASLELSNFKIAFENGCNEYIKKPFYLKELEIRINNLIKNKNNKDDILKLSTNISYNKDSQELIVNNEVKHLRKKEKRLLNILIEKEVRT
jgi:DNA-binding response OmpR family regulator